MLQNLFSIRQFRLTKWSFLVHSTMCNDPYIHQSHGLILELWQTFPNADGRCRLNINGLNDKVPDTGDFFSFCCLSNT